VNFEEGRHREDDKHDIRKDGQSPKYSELDKSFGACAWRRLAAIFSLCFGDVPGSGKTCQ
jgi:hypothetical protein